MTEEPSDGGTLKFPWVIPAPGAARPPAHQFDADGTTHEGPAGRPPAAESTVAGPLPGGQRVEAPRSNPDAETRVGPTTPAPPLLTGPFGVVLPIPRPAAPPAEPFGEGTSVGGFGVGARLGGGPAVEQFAATHPQHGACTLHALTPGAAASAATVRAFLGEARARTASDDERLGRVLALGEAPRPWFVEVALPRTTLEELLARGPVAPARAAAVALEVARALARLHARGRAHGDLHPGAVHLDDAGRVKLGGLGAVRAVDPSGAWRAWPDGPVEGPAWWTAPERLRGLPPTPASDVWSLGLLVLAMLDGRAPIRGDAAAVRAALSSFPPQPGRDVPPPLASVVRRCLSLEPATRYPTAQALAEALRAATPAGRDPRRLVAAALLLAAVAALVGWLLARG